MFLLNSSSKRNVSKIKKQERLVQDGGEKGHVLISCESMKITTTYSKL